MQCINQLTIIPKGHSRPIVVPCGKCIPCLQTKRMQWSFRIEQEMKVSRTAYFVTLTYDNWHLKKAEYQLNKRDLQLYLKRLRKKAHHIRIRYYAVGEYGSKSGRAHYHLILFNADEEIIRNSWVNPKTKKPMGIVHVGQVTQASINYVLKYIVQPEQKDWYVIERPFSTMSRMYGIGAHYLTDEMINWHRSGDKNYTMVYGVKQPLPKFYYPKIWQDKYELERIKQKNKWQSIREHRNKLREWRKEFGSEWKVKRAEHIQASIDRVKTKINKTQHL